MAKVYECCLRCGGPLDETGRSWVYAKADKPAFIVRICSACSALPIDKCLMCKLNPAVPGQPLCAACHAAI